jgi:hypothetical protein
LSVSQEKSIIALQDEIGIRRIRGAKSLGKVGFEAAKFGLSNKFG